jgi:hypothetical protein
MNAKPAAAFAGMLRTGHFTTYLSEIDGEPAAAIVPSKRFVLTLLA